ncbi:Fe-S cluster assembly protein SufD [Nocardioides jishulii]|uniref:Fe-S cluster assembly protein SufD n=1 Tax=Nocardioides jishulii TaxID=2575440 RepID=A0A4U2YQT2_9ACTN|nr:Fe-S cluster assembly protein SufD [Nocardioides jishulii]QCX27494.1 Fe-S cluster assembly protein SufD [Nocardioides jishulii]TKI62301.1 Fe-S cluster assembly protein SufD [Nocardioides jishulii]
MTVTDTARDSVAAALEQGKVESHLHPTGSYDVADHAAPTGREEIWRFTPLKRLKGLASDAVFNAPTTEVTHVAPEGVRVETVTGDEAQALRGVSGYKPATLFGARVLSEVPDTLLVDVPAETEVVEPIIVNLTGTDAENTEAGHVVLRFGNFSKAVVVLRHTGSAALAQVVEIRVGDSAQVSVVSLQDWADDATHLTHTEALVGRDAAYKHTAISFGGDLVRMDANVRYSAPGGSAEMLGLYFADEGQHLEHRLFADHNQPRTSSNVMYKGALQGEGAHTVWIGNVLIRKEAEGIETYEENRNLILTDGTLCDSVPNLEIETGEIAGAGHASATARFDDEQLFYLRSRGIDEKEAQRLVVHGFFNDLIRKIGVPAIEEQLVTTVETELAKNLTGKLL